MDHDDVEAASLGIGQHLLERRALAKVVGSGTTSFVGVIPDDLPAVSFTVKSSHACLGIEGIPLDLLFSRDTVIHPGAKCTSDTLHPSPS
ncbi:MAG: hypothetical protein M3R02_08365 [Chloroflexota bacterium]|nr:hypothetical protein [Chloroflexota bacterium]